MSDQCGKSKLPLPSEQGLPAGVNLAAGLGVFPKDQPTGDKGIDAVNKALARGSPGPSGVLKETVETVFTWPGEQLIWTPDARLNNQKLLCVYNHAPVNKEQLTQVLQQHLGPNIPFLRIACALQTNGTATVSILYDFGKPLKRKHECLALEGSTPIMVRKLKNKKQFAEAAQFLGRTDADNADLRDAAQGSAKANSLCEAIQNGYAEGKSEDQLLRELVVKPADFFGVERALKRFKPKKAEYDPLTGKQLYGWQRHLEAICDEKDPDRRVIYVVYDPLGSAGKTDFCSHLEAKYGRDVFTLDSMGVYRDIATIIKDATDSEEWTGRILLIDLPRDAEDKKIYETLEGLRIGKFTATKYRGGRAKYRADIILMFTNWMPDVLRLTLDRWYKVDGSSTIFWLRDPEGAEQKMVEMKRPGSRMVVRLRNNQAMRPQMVLQPLDYMEAVNVRVMSQAQKHTGILAIPPLPYMTQQ
jgi:hypothetical protein